MEPTISNNKTLIWVMVIVAVVVLGGLVWIFMSGQPALQTGQEEEVLPPSLTPPPPAAVKEDSTQAINKDIGSVDLGNLDEDFKTIDNDLNSL